MDPLSDVLSLLKPRSTVSRGFSAGGDWAIQFPRKEGIKCYAVVSGRCWLAVEGSPEAVLLKAGDCFLLPTGRPFRLASDLAVKPVAAAAIYATVNDGGTVLCNGGGEFFLVGSYFALAGGHAGTLLGMLPPVVHLHAPSEQMALRWAVERMMQEIRDEQPGSFLVTRHLAHLMLVQALRLHMSEGPKGGVGWLFALADRQIGAALTAMHHDPGQRWTLQALAERAAMSRSAFAAKFKDTVGASPLEYLTRWRMLLAGDRLATSSQPVAGIALSLGYASESAFSAAFRRTMDCSPRQYGRGRASTARPGDTKRRRPHDAGSPPNRAPGMPS